MGRGKHPVEKRPDRFMVATTSIQRLRGLLEIRLTQLAKLPGNMQPSHLSLVV